MSSRKAATAKTSATRNGAAKPAGKVAPAQKVEPVAEAAATPAGTSASDQAAALAARIEGDLMDGRLDTLSQDTLQRLMAALCKSYSMQIEAGASFLPIAAGQTASPTEIMTTTSGLLKAGNLAVFELGMWQSWTGR